MTPLTSERVPRTRVSSTLEELGGAFQYEFADPESSGARSDKDGAESAAAGT